MSKRLYMGIDGGGSTLRVGIYDKDLTPVVEILKPHSANPSVLGRDVVRDYVRATVEEALAEIPSNTGKVFAVGVGMSGADSRHSLTWLHDMLNPVLPDSKIIASSDYEIALVGATGERYGVLILAGTGSVAFGINRGGQSVRVGGWGYLLGDEGSGYWLGIQAIRHLSYVIDTDRTETMLSRELRDTIDIDLSHDQFVDWLYRPKRQSFEIARLAKVVLVAADQGCAAASAIVREGVDHLCWHYDTILERLNVSSPPVAFAGGLLSSENPLSLGLAKQLGLPEIPQNRYSPVMGAARLAYLQTKSEHEN
jgi:N-acetylglucosamine kinase-like BadF-type ATPase